MLFTRVFKEDLSNFYRDVCVVQVKSSDVGHWLVLLWFHDQLHAGWSSSVLLNLVPYKMKILNSLRPG